MHLSDLSSVPKPSVSLMKSNFQGESYYFITSNRISFKEYFFLLEDRSFYNLEICCSNEMANRQEAAGPSKQSSPPKKGRVKKDADNLDELAPIIPLPPDGGWGWVIVAVCSVGNFCVDSASLSFPSMQLHLAKIFNASLAQISLIVSLHTGMCYLCGPLSGAIANRIGFRLTMLIGAAFGFMGIGVCYFLTDFIAHVCCFGVIAGTGGSLVYMTSMAAPSFWFEEKRALAAGISSCTSGLAAVIVPIAASSIEENFNWRLVFIIPAGVYLVLFFLAFLIQTAPAVYVHDEKPKKAIKKEDIFYPTSVVSLLGGGAQSQRKLLQISQHVGLRTDQITDIPFTIMEPRRRKCTCCRVRTIERPMYKKDVFYQGSVIRIRERHKLLPGQYTVSVAKIPTLRDIKEEIDCKCTLCPEAIKRGLKTLFNFAVCSNKSFIMIFFSTFFFFGGIYIPFLYLKRVSMENHVEAKYANLLTPLFGVGVTISRCTIGLILLLFPRLGALNITVAALIITSFINILLSVNFNVVYQITMNLLFGYTSGLYVPVRSVILIDYVGLEKLTNAMGFIFTVQGIGAFSGIPLAELLMSSFKDSRWAFYYAAIVFFISMCFLIPVYFFPIHHPEIL